MNNKQLTIMVILLFILLGITCLHLRKTQLSLLKVEDQIEQTTDMFEMVLKIDNQQTELINILLSKETVINVEVEAPVEVIPAYGTADVRETDPPIPMTSEAIINMYIDEICSMDEYSNVDSFLIRSMVEQESSYNPIAISSGNDQGLLQVNLKWHSERAESLDVDNILDPYGNLLVGIDFISELLDQYDEPLALMLYNMRWESAFEMYESGRVSEYAKNVMVRRDRLKQEE